MDAPISRILQLFEDWAIERLAHTEHPSFPGTNLGAKPHNELLISVFRQVCHVNRVKGAVPATASISPDVVPQQLRSHDSQPLITRIRDAIHSALLLPLQLTPRIGLPTAWA